MNINFFIIIGLIYMATEEWILTGAAPKAKGKIPRYRTLSSEERVSAVEKFKRSYYPVLNHYWEKMRDDKSVMKSAVGCAKLALVCPFLNAWRLVLLGIGYGLDADLIKSFMTTDGISSMAPPDEFYHQVFVFNELAEKVGDTWDDLDMSHVFESTDLTLKSLVTRFISGTNQLSKFAVHQMGNSLKSCLEMYGHITTDRKTVQDFVDAIKNRTRALMDSKGKDPPTYATDKPNPAGILGGLKDFVWKHHDLPNEILAKIKAVDAVCRAAGASVSRSSEKLAWSNILGYFRGGEQEEDPFKDCIKIDLRGMDYEDSYD